MAAIQLSFSLRTTPNVKQVHLIGSWDGYQGQLPLSRDHGSKWKGTFRFQPTVMLPAQRYWFYYMLDGYQVSHDPSKPFTQEPTTGRSLNILDVPASAAKHSDHSRGQHASKRSSRRYSREIPRGRPADEIRSPRPVRPSHLARQLEAAAHNQAALDALSERLRRTRLEDGETDGSDDSDDSYDSYDSYDVPSLSSGSGSSVSGCSSPSSLSSGSSGCSCERYGITRAGQRVKLDCGGKRCGFGEGDADDDDDDEEDSSEEEGYKTRVRRARRRGVVLR